MEDVKSKKKLILILALLFLFCALILIGIGIYFNYLSKPTKIVEKTIVETSTYLKPYFFVKEDNLLSGSFTIDSDIKTTISSEYREKLSANDPESKTLTQMFKNLSNSKTTLHIAKDLDNKKLHLNINNKVNKANLDYSLLVTNATEYYKVGNITEGYINSGTNNYFESLVNDTTSEENYEYLYDFITSRIGTYIEEEDITKYPATTTVLDKDVKVNKLSIKLTNDLLNNYKDKLYNDLKNDTKAKNIIESYNDEFFKKKQKNIKFFTKDEGLTVNIYTSTILSKVVKIEFEYSNNTDKEIISYEKGNNDNSIITIRKNDKMLYTLRITTKDKELQIKIQDSKDTNIGTISYSNDSSGIKFNADINNDTDKYLASYQVKKSNQKKTSCDRKDTLTFKYIKDKTTRIDLKVEATSKITTKVDIKENIDNAVLEKKLTDETKDKIDNYLVNYLNEISK